jgi:NADH:ubiquinone reductase (H+-translocating)
VVVVGAGFGGLAVARGLAGIDVDVTIVDRNNFHTFQPLLYQVAKAGLSGVDVGHAVRALFQRQDNVRFRRATVVGVDRDSRQVNLADGDRLRYDLLVLGAGASTSWFGVDGAEEHALPLYGLTDALRLRNHILDRFERVDADRTQIAEGALTFVVVGGGPTGVEMAGALIELVDMALAHDLRHLDLSRVVRVVLVERGETLLPLFAPSSQRHARNALEARGVWVRLSDAVTRIDAKAVHLASGVSVPCQTAIWAAGVKANPLAGALGLEQGRAGRIVVGADLSVPGDPAVFVVGDVAAAAGTDGRPLPQLAPVAIQEGRHAARQICRRLEGRATTPFRYRDPGLMATIGRGAGVAELRSGLRFHGAPGWVAWLLLHLVILVGVRNRISVLVSWAWNYLTWDRAYRLIIELPTADRATARPGCRA